ncbi:MAG: hypothetical protein KJO07_09710, partial [Deltaproteobacteria bacterium]|nr:hypothetical protein [Deltaproteobacteria bacterium]
MIRLTLALMLVVGCGDSKKSGPPKPARTPEASFHDASPGQKQSNQMFCDSVFSPGEVAELAGAEFLGTRPAKVRTGVGECQYAFSKDGQPASITMAADCNAEHPKYGSMVSSMKSGKGFEEVDIGAGGARMALPDGKTTRLSFESEVPS